MKYEEFTENPWQGAHDEFISTVLPKLQRYGKRIGQDSISGDRCATDIVKYYKMIERSFDLMTLMLLSDALEKWIAEAVGSKT